MERIGPGSTTMDEGPGWRAPDARTDVEQLAALARALEEAGLLDRALRTWRAVLKIDRNCLPAWEGAARILRTLKRDERKRTA